MKKGSYLCGLMALLAAGCGSWKISSHPSGLPERYQNSQYNFTFWLPAGWRGYSVLIQRWEGGTYSPERDRVVAREHGPEIVLRHPQWRPGKLYQDIPIRVFSRGQWLDNRSGKFSIGAGGLDEEIGHNSKYVFAISSRFNADDSVKGWKEASEAVAQNQAAGAPHWLPE